MATIAILDMLRRSKKRSKVTEWWCKRISCLAEEVYTTTGFCVSRFPAEKICSTESRKIGIGARRQILQTHLSGGITQKLEPHERNPCAPMFEERSREITLQEEGGARKAPWNLAKHIFKLKHADKATFYFPIEARTTPAPTSKLSEEREFVIDSGTSMHMLSRRDLSSEHMDTLRRSRTPTVWITKNGEVQTHEEAPVYVHDLGLFRDCGSARGHCCSSYR